MKANELRIGNLYDNNGNYFVVTPSTIESVFESERVWCKPIPLTEEWLFKCAFIKVDDEDEVYYTSGYNEFHIKIEDKVFWIYFDEQPNHPITCVFNLHQLQNLIFALTENELNVTL